MKIGFGPHKTDISMRWMAIESDGVQHTIFWKYHFFKGYELISYDCKKDAKIVAAFPPVLAALREIGAIILADAKREITHKLQNNGLSRSRLIRFWQRKSQGK